MPEFAQPVRLAPDSPGIPSVLALIRESFADMEGRIDPPSSMHALTEEGIEAQCMAGEVWTLGQPPYACVFLTARTDALYLGKLAVAAAQRGQGYARRLVDLAETRARACGLSALELQTRMELVENHAAFARMGFVRVGTFTHPGYARPTSLRMRKQVRG